MFIKIALIGLIILSFIIYLGGSFIALSFNPVNWAIELRFVCVIFWMIGNFIILNIASEITS